MVLRRNITPSKSLIAGGEKYMKAEYSWAISFDRLVIISATYSNISSHNRIANANEMVNIKKKKVCNS
jgi:hypothetical protein